MPEPLLDAGQLRLIGEGTAAPTADMALGGLSVALRHLRTGGPPADLLHRTTVELVESCGFERAVIARVVQPGRLEVVAAYADPGGADFDARMKTWRDEPAPVVPSIVEGEVVRLRRSALVRNARTNPRTYKPIIEALALDSYVVAPLTPGGRVEALIHVDRPSAGVTGTDREMLQLFAEGVSMVLERDQMSARLRRHDERMRLLLGQAEGLLEDLIEDTVDLAATQPSVDTLSDRRGAASTTAVPMSVLSLLTRREIEVLERMAEGETNAAIASALVISEVTVKSHVQHILRKLRASNRAQASARYIRLRQSR